MRLTTPLGQEVACRASCLALRDAASGRAVVLGQVQSRVGLIRPPDQVLYTNGFGDEGLRADLRLTYTAQGLEQDLILREWPVRAAEVSVANLRLEVWTEWFGAEPTEREIQPLDLRQTLAGEGSVLVADETIAIGGMKIVSGRAFGLPEGRSVPVGRSWVVTEDGRRCGWWIITRRWRGLRPTAAGGGSMRWSGAGTGPRGGGSELVAGHIGSDGVGLAG